MSHEFLESVITEVMDNADLAVSTAPSLDVGAVDARRIIQERFRPRLLVADRLDNVAASQGESAGLKGRREGI